MTMDDGPRQRSALFYGALGAALYTIFALAISPIVYDETVVAGAVIAGLPPLPVGHPHTYFYVKALSLGNYVAAALLHWFHSAELVSVLRGGVSLWLSIFTPYAITLLLTRRWTWALFTVALVASESLVSYDGIYPVFVFPDVYSHGQIGQTFTLLVIAAWLGGWTRFAAFACGAMPMIHGGMTPALWLWSAAFLAFSSLKPRGADLRRALSWGFAGLLACGAFWAVTQWMASSLHAAPPYVAPSADLSYGRGFVEMTDFHRQTIPFDRYGYSVHGVVALLIVAAIWRYANSIAAEEPARASRLRWTLAVVVIAWGYLFVATLLRRLDLLPYIVLITMPARMTNLSTWLLPPLIVVGCASLRRSLPELAARAWLLGLASAMGLAAAWTFLRGHNLTRSHGITAVLGMLLGAGAWMLPTRRRVGVGALVALAVVFAAIEALHPQTQRQFSLALGFAAALAACAVVPFLLRRAPVGITRAAMVLGCSAILVSAAPGRLYDSWNQWRADILSRFDVELRDWLKSHATPDEPILTPAWQRSELQLKTGQPVLFELETLWMLTYMPQLGDSLGPMIVDLFGVDYSDVDGLRASTGGDRLRLDDPRWRATWMERTAQDWKPLSNKYGFRLIVAPKDTPLQLPLAIENGDWRLYVVE